MYESILYSDPQATKPGCFCDKCGAECYPPSFICLRCERKEKIPSIKDISFVKKTAA